MNQRLGELNANIARIVRSLRHARGWSLGVLAERAGLSKTIVAKIETGDGNPSIETLLRLADALQITIGTLLAADRPPGTEVIRLDETTTVRSESGLAARTIWSDGRDRRVEVHEVVIEANGDYRSAPHPPGTEELIICVSGSLQVGPKGHEVELGERDAARFLADVEHEYRSQDGCAALLLMSYPAANAT
jgi:transcriptional regulator with XRE-family HTH domain